MNISTIDVHATARAAVVAVALAVPSGVAADLTITESTTVSI